MSGGTQRTAVQEDNVSHGARTYAARAYAAGSATAGLAPISIPRRTLGAHDVQIEILYCGVCHSDLHQVRNESQNAMPTVYPCVPGHEIVGRVVRTGGVVKKFQEGDLAAVGCMVDSCRTCPQCRAGLEQYCESLPTFTYNFPDKHLGGITYGGYSESIVEAHFGCPVRFGARQNALLFRIADLDRPFVTHNPDVLAMVAPQLEAELSQQLAQQTIGERVKGLLKRLRAGQRPGIQDVARELQLSMRTLQRRLTEQGHTFQQWLEDARRELARHCLVHSSLELNETAYLLGYEDANSFFRAFHHREGTSPGQWRGRQRNAQQAQSAQSQPA